MVSAVAEVSTGRFGGRRGWALSMEGMGEVTEVLQEEMIPERNLKAQVKNVGEISRQWNQHKQSHDQYQQ